MCVCGGRGVRQGRRGGEGTAGQREGGGTRREMGGGGGEEIRIVVVKLASTVSCFGSSAVAACQKEQRDATGAVPSVKRPRDVVVCR